LALELDVLGAGCAHKAGTSKQLAMNATPLNALKLAIELPILFCDWTVYF
jgi:hypothetical protein